MSRALISDQSMCENAEVNDFYSMQVFMAFQLLCFFCFFCCTGLVARLRYPVGKNGTSAPSTAGFSYGKPPDSPARRCCQLNNTGSFIRPSMFCLFFYAFSLFL